MYIELLLGIIVIIIFIFFITNKKNYQKEHLNEGTFYEIDPNVQNNLNINSYSLCTKDIRSNSVGDRYCYDLPNFKKHINPIYNSPLWVQTKYPSYFYPPYQTYNDKSQYMFSPDWWHRYSE